MLWRFDVGLTARRIWCIVQAAVLWGLSAQGGYPGIAITTPILLTLWAVGRLCTVRGEIEDGPSHCRRGIFLSVALVLYTCA